MNSWVWTKNWKINKQVGLYLAPEHLRVKEAKKYFNSSTSSKWRQLKLVFKISVNRRPVANGELLAKYWGNASSC